MSEEKITFNQELYNNNKHYKVTADNISEIKETDKGLDELLKRIQEVYRKNKERYEMISESNGYVPPEVLAAIHYKENAGDFLSGNFSVYLHNGVPLGEINEKVPKPDFFDTDQFDEAAADALTGTNNYFITYAKRLELEPDSKDLTAMVAFTIIYHGWEEGKPGYAYSGTDIYEGGLYTSDGQYDANVKDKNVGTYLVLKTLLDQ